jgi:hypothetical protein
MGLIWGTIISVLGLVGAILIAAAGRLLSDDVKEWLPWITRRLIERAVSRLPENERERLEEEWWSHVNELPGNLAKVYVAWGYLSASKAINHIALSGETTHVVGERTREAQRRTLDIVITVLVLFVVNPIMSVIALAIKMDSRGPVLVRQKRLGANNRPFDRLKFRSMYVEAGAPRITRVGRFLRKTSLDELPQLINVLRGEMSLVGPRPRRWPH